jgi:hypothetical protein
MSYSGIWDGFDDYDASHQLWDAVSGTPQYSSAYARFVAAPGCVAQGVRFSGAFGVNKTKNLNGNYARYMWGFPFYVEALPAGGWAPIMLFQDNGTTQCQLAVSASGQIGIVFGATPIAVSAPGTIAGAHYYWCDLDLTINNTTGAVLLYLSTPAGGGALINASGLNTRNGTANNYLNQFTIGTFSNAISVRFDDFHAHDPGGAAPNSILGEGTRIYTKLPTGAGALTNWTPNGAVANWQCVDDNPPDDDTTYVSAAAVLEDAYAHTAAGFTGTVNGVVRRSRIRKDDGSAHTFQNGVRSSGVDQLATAVAVLSTYAYTDSFSSTDPNTSAAWTAAAADAAQSIIKEAS